MTTVPEAAASEPNGIPLKDWIEGAPVGRTAAYSLLKVMGLTPEKAIFPGYPKPIPFLAPDQQAAMDAAALMMKNGKTLSQVAAKMNGEPDPEVIAPRPAGAVALAQSEALATLADSIAQAVAQIAPQQPPQADPLRVAERLHRAAELGAWLSTPELAELLGVSRTAPDPVAWVDRFPRPGFRAEVVKHGRGWFWRLSHDGPAPTVRSLTPAAPDRPVGFGALLEASAVTVERHVSPLGPQLPALPRPWA